MPEDVNDLIQFDECKMLHTNSIRANQNPTYTVH